VVPIKTTEQPDPVSWGRYDYTVRLKTFTTFSNLMYGLSEAIHASGGEIFQTYFQPDKQRATIVIGVGSFITHNIIFSWLPSPVFPESSPSPAQNETTKHFNVAIVIDDLGANTQVVSRLLEFNEDFTFSILPHQEKSTEIATLLHKHHKEILLHLPMEPQNYPAQSPGEGAIMSNMAPQRVHQTIAQNLQTVPFAVGVNNHMGSRLTADWERMHVVLQNLAYHQLFFLDSRTTASSVAYSLAQQLGVKSAERKVFLDVIPEIDFVKNQLHELVSLAEQGKPAIAIGHPKEATLHALKEMMPEFKLRNIKIVRVSQFMQ
jgi:polysaccharide deacetylase 2 family uncharacterized protein YibQ